jgi:hypothetical protein
MKKAAGIVLVVVVLLGAPMAWHYHSPISWLPAFPASHQAPPTPTDPLVEDSPGGSVAVPESGGLAESNLHSSQPPADLSSPAAPPSGLPPVPPAMPPVAEPLVPPDTAPPAQVEAPGDDGDLFSLEAVEDPATPESIDQLSPSIPPPPPPAQSVEVPPPLPVLP